LCSGQDVRWKFQIMNSKISYVIIDTLHHRLSSIALERSMSEFPLDDVLIFTDKPKLWGGRNVIEIDELKGTVDYNKVMFYELPKFLKTEFAIIIQYDGYVLSGEHFNQKFLDYDYIGAPWPHFEHFNVGNGGFSLRSAKLIKAVQKYLLPEDLKKPEDVIICRYLRARLEDDLKCKFAPASIAKYFSFEMVTVDHPTFGFHGLYHLPFTMSEDIDTLLENINPKSTWRVFRSFARAFDGMPELTQRKFVKYCETHYPELVAITRKNSSFAKS
jgi:hypothetical protein